MQMVHLVIVELTHHSLQNHVTWILQGIVTWILQGIVTWILQGIFVQLKNHKVNYLHNLETITMGII